MVLYIIIGWIMLGLINYFTLKLYDCIASFRKNNVLVTCSYITIAVVVLATLIPRLTFLPLEALLRKK